MIERNETISPLRQRKLPPNTRTGRCILLPANRYGTPIPYSRAVWLRSSL